MHSLTLRRHALRLLASGLTVSEVSRQTGVNRATVRRAFPGLSRQGCCEVNSFSKHWTHLFPQHGPGKRVRRHFNGEDHFYEYPRYLFVNMSQDILDLCGEALDRLGVGWRYSKPTTISVATREAVAGLDRFVGPKC